MLPLHTHTHTECHVDTTTIADQWQGWTGLVKVPAGARLPWPVQFHILTRSSLGGIESDCRRISKESQERSRTESLLFWQPVPHSSSSPLPLVRTTAMTLGWHLSRNWWLGISPVCFGLHRHNCTWPGSAICDTWSRKKKQRQRCQNVPTNCGAATLLSSPSTSTRG